MRERLLVPAMLLACLVSPRRTDAQLPRILILGDSISADTSLGSARDQWPYLVQGEANVIVHLFALPFAKLSPQGKYEGLGQQFRAFQQLDGAARLSAVVILLGTNDWAGNIDPNVFQSTYETLLRHLRKPMPVICVTPLWRADEARANENGVTLERFREVVREVCRGEVVVEGPQLVPGQQSYYAGPIHPNEKGARALAKGLAPVIADAVRSPTARKLDPAILHLHKALREGLRRKSETPADPHLSTTQSTHEDSD